jgi:curved DNA binding protein
MADVDSDDEQMPPMPPTKEEEDVGKTAEEEKNASLANPDVVTKYKEAAKIAQASLIEISAKCVPGAVIFDICKFGDEDITQRCADVYKTKDKKTGKMMMKGVAFPVCISVNECICHMSPLVTEADKYPVLAEGDFVKIDMGVHIDGFISVVAHTVVVGFDRSVPANVESLKGPRGNVISATYVAAEVASKLIKAGNTNAIVTAAIKQVAAMFDVRPISGTLMHQMKQYIVDGNKVILLRDDSGETKVDACTFETMEVYAIDIAMSSGDGKPKEKGDRTTVHKRQVEKKYRLKSNSSRELLNIVNDKYPTMPFSLRSLVDERGAKLGVRECVNHELLAAYPVLHEKKGDFIGHTKFTVLLLPNGSSAVVTGLPPVTLENLEETNIGLSLVNKLIAEKGEGFEVPKEIIELLSMAAPEPKAKKPKKPKTKKTPAP